MIRNFKNYSDFIKSFSQVVIIDKETMLLLEDFALKLNAAKQNEFHHIIDNKSGIKRFTTGLLGEHAIEKLLGINIINWNIGNSKEFHNPDIPNYKVGIKTVEYGKFPIIFKKSYYPQIICIVKKRSDASVVYVCGIATTDVLNSYQDDDLILDQALRSRGTKTGFWGFEHLIPLTSIEDLKEYKRI